MNDGRVSELYDFAAVKAYQQSLAERHGINIGQSFGPWWNPPFYALLFAPLASMSFAAAVDVWLLINLACLLLSITMLLSFLPPHTEWRTWALVPLLILISMPTIQALTHGQNTCTSLLLLTMTVTSWRQGRGVLAGAIAGLLFYKPQLAAIVAIVMVLNLGWRPLLGLAITGCALLLVTIKTMPGMIGHYLHQLPANVHYAQVLHPYMWERHATLKAFWRLLLQGHEAGELTAMMTAMYVASLALIGGGLVYAIMQTRRPALDACWSGETTAIRRDRLIAAAIIAMPLLMPFYFDYDLLLLAIPAVLLANEMLRRESDLPLRTGEVWLLRAWILLFVWTMANPVVAETTGVNATVVVLTTIALLSIGRAARYSAAADVASASKIANVTMTGTMIRRAA
jgi:hypothetical protein